MPRGHKPDKVKFVFDKLRVMQSDDKRNWILQKLNEGNINVRTGIIAESRWVDVGYYGRLEHLAEAIINRSIEVPNASSLDEQLKAILEELKRVEKSLLEQMRVIE